MATDTDDHPVAKVLCSALAAEAMRLAVSMDPELVAAGVVVEVDPSLRGGQMLFVDESGEPTTEGLGVDDLDTIMATIAAKSKR